jgi:hypothetical protein
MNLHVIKCLSNRFCSLVQNLAQVFTLGQQHPSIEQCSLQEKNENGSSNGEDLLLSLASEEHGPHQPANA